ncbi:MAG: hypothetical protein COV91_04120 [Candidatus Taylorbacteria bacterium CG11_big_fil_rev_8_21_14_0_20_46_11]|uniref:Bacteriocin-protection protein n=1 Tax=Candidatus Taylorbacteria bacterium CG11_big_fil_rev_8_21_14_0_20_46_11 TaxID=1975025 RepID=A0A2H0KDF9_9BACT|nr:MAG: hypothetical protein COV91_04120 [Candidatus Taylorbacteria bacterium CG11_big_fil_rev_8_21_14_0_20_46_11]
MSKQKISAGVVHDVPADVRKALTSFGVAREVWEDITPLARNEFLCWITSAKKSETRIRRIKTALSKLKAGDRRPCCFAGCVHR